MQEHRFVNLSFIEGDANASEAYLYTDEQLDFDSQVETSYLPALIQMARESGHHLTFVRIKVQPDVSQEKLDSYNADLSSYLAANNVDYVDFGSAPRLTEDHFQDMLLLNQQGRALFTRMLADALTELSSGR